MTLIIAASAPAPGVPDAVVPNQASIERPAGGPGPVADRPPQSARPRANPNLAPRCGAKTRAGCPCRAPAMRNGRCRMHGGKSTGARTQEGLARLAALHTTRGYFTAAARAVDLHRRTLVSRIRITCAATMLEAFLPPDLAARLALPPPELDAPVHPSNAAFAAAADNTPCNGRRDARGRFVARARPAVRGRMAEREAARREAATLAPWHAAIRQARLAERAARAAARAARGQQPMQRATERSAGAEVVAASGRLPGKRGQHAMQRAMEQLGSVAARLGIEAGQRVLAGERGQQPVQRAMEPSAGMAAESGSAACHGAPFVARGQQPMQRGMEASAGMTVGSRPVARQGAPLAEPVGPFRRGLLSSTARSKPLARIAAWRLPAVRALAADDSAAQRLTAQAERAGEWTVVLAILEARKVGGDWRPGVAEARRRIKQDAERFAADCLLRVGIGAVVPAAGGPWRSGLVWGEVELPL